MATATRAAWLTLLVLAVILIGELRLGPETAANRYLSRPCTRCPSPRHSTTSLNALCSWRVVALRNPFLKRKNPASPGRR